MNPLLGQSRCSDSFATAPVSRDCVRTVCFRSMNTISLDLMLFWLRNISYCSSARGIAMIMMHAPARAIRIRCLKVNRESP